MNIYKQKQTNLFSSLSIPLDVIRKTVLISVLAVLFWPYFCSGRMLKVLGLEVRVDALALTF